MPSKTLTSRRNFLTKATRGSFLCLLATQGITFISGCTHKKLLNPDEDILLSGGNYRGHDKRYDALILINLSQKEKRVIPCDFLPHGIVIDPNDKYRILCFEKNGTNACSINIKDLVISETYHCHEQSLFSGHAAFSKDGKHLYTIEQNKTNKQGSIVVRDAKNFNIIKTLPTLGLSPVDCQLISDHTLLVSNTGRDESGFHQPSIVYIDLESEKLIRREKLDNGNLNAALFYATKNDQLIVASGNIDQTDPALTGGISFRDKNETLTTVTGPVEVVSRMTGSATSIAFDNNSNTVAITQPQAGLLSFWSLKDKQIIRAVGLDSPRSICLSIDKKHFIVNYGKKPVMVKTRIKDQAPVAESYVQPTFTSGTYMLNWSLELREIMPSHIYD